MQSFNVTRGCIRHKLPEEALEEKENLKATNLKSYRNAVEYLFGLHRIGIKLGLDNINALLDFLKRPERRYPTIHFAGTNGKGSTAAMVYSILKNAGFKTGLYTSPHLVSFTERIRVNDVAISEEAVLEFTRSIVPLADKLKVSFFEVTTAMAFWYFRQQEVDIAVIESGMGGRLDSTNVLEPLATVLTPISFDHTNYLGSTLESIVREKAGIIKPGISCLTNNRNGNVRTLLEEICKQKGSSFIEATSVVNLNNIECNLNSCYFDLNFQDGDAQRIHLPLAGEFQSENARLAAAVAKVLSGKLQISNSNIYNGLRNAYWPARLQIIDEHPRTIVDVSHNPEGLRQSLNFIRNCDRKRQLKCVLSLQADKNYKEIARLLAANCVQVYVVPLNKGKPQNSGILCDAIRRAGGSAEIVPSASGALKLRRQQSEAATWLITGSHYLAGEIFEILQIPVIPAVSETVSGPVI